MPIIKNKLKQRIQVDLGNGKTLGLLARGSATVEDNELSSPHLRGFIERGEIIVIPSEKKEVKGKKSVKKEGNYIS